MLFPKIIGKIVCAIAITLLTPAAYANQTVDLLFFNDFHGQVLEEKNDHIPGIAKFVTAVQTIEQQHPNYILVAGGDNYTGQIISDFHHGTPINEMMRYLGVKASAVGNHDFDWGSAYLAKFGQEGNFYFVAANLFDRNTHQRPNWAKPYLIIKKGNLKIALIGILTQETPRTTKSINFKKYYLANNIESLQYWIDYLKAGKDQNGIPNAIIALTHLPSWQAHPNDKITGDEINLLLNNIHGVDALVSAHSHQLVSGTIAGIPVLQAACHGKALGDFTLTFDDQGKLLSVTPTLDIFMNQTDHITPNQSMLDRVNRYHQQMARYMDQVIGEADADYLHHGKKGDICPLGRWVAKLMLQSSNTQIALVNRGGIRHSLLKGPVTLGSIHEMIPFNNYLVKFKLSGKNLKTVIEHALASSKNEPIELAGLKVFYDPTKPIGQRLVKMQLDNGSEILDNNYYRVVTIDFLFDGGGNYHFTNPKNVHYLNLERAVVIAAIRKSKVISLDSEYYTKRFIPIH